MTKVPYTKVALTYADQLQQLKDRGLMVLNDAKALHLLEAVSYYRLSGYWYPLLADKEQHAFKTGASFDTAFSIYKFDRELRLLILRELEKIEVAVRAKMIYVISRSRGSFWYKDTVNFNRPQKHTETLAKIYQEYKRSDEEFIKAFQQKYSDPLPPSWMMLEVTSFGTLSALYSYLTPGRDKRDIANHFGLPEVVFTSWLHSIVYLRNICAHHARLWNKEMQIQPIIPNFPKKTFITKTYYTCPNTGKVLPLNNRVYFILSMILYFMNTINPKHNVQEKVKTLLEKYSNIDVRAMGFPTDWVKEHLWK